MIKGSNDQPIDHKPPRTARACMLKLKALVWVESPPATKSTIQARPGSLADVVDDQYFTLMQLQLANVTSMQPVQVDDL